MCKHVYIHNCACMHLYMQVGKYVRVHVGVCAKRYACMRAHVQTNVCMAGYTCVCASIRTPVLTCVCMYVRYPRVLVCMYRCKYASMHAMPNKPMWR